MKQRSRMNLILKICSRQRLSGAASAIVQQWPAAICTVRCNGSAIMVIIFRRLRIWCLKQAIGVPNAAAYRRGISESLQNTFRFMHKYGTTTTRVMKRNHILQGMPAIYPPTKQVPLIHKGDNALRFIAGKFVGKVLRIFFIQCMRPRH